MIMLVLHANWSGGGISVWAERSPAADGGPESNGVMPAGDGAPRAHPFAATPAEVEAHLRDAGLLPADGPDAPNADEHEDVEADDTGPGPSPRPALAADRLVLRLPAIDGRPLPSERFAALAGGGGDPADATIAEVEVPTLRLGPADGLDLLLRLGAAPVTTADAALSSSVHYWAGVARLANELLCDDRIVPTLLHPRGGELEARWQPWLHDGSARERVGALVASMPPVVRAVVDEHDGRPWPILDEALVAMTDGAVRRALAAEDYVDAIDGRDPEEDPQVAWLAGLLAERRAVRPGPEHRSAMLRTVGEWIGVLDEAGRDRPMRLALILDPPENAPEPEADTGKAKAKARRAAPPEDEQWRLVFALTAPGEDPLVIEAEEIWSGDAATTLPPQVRHPDELLLAELGRAARVYPAIESVLKEDQPTELLLETPDAYEFLVEHRPLLEESGFEVVVPPWWGRASARLGARLHIDSPPLEESEAGGPTLAGGAPLLGLQSLVRYQWRIAAGDRVLTAEEFSRLVEQARKGVPLVRLGGHWVELRPDEIEAAAKLMEETPEGEMTLLEAVQLAHGAAGGTGGVPVQGLKATGWVADLLDAQTASSKLPQLNEPDGFFGELRPYQRNGLSWLAFLDRFGLGACLADDMGLGKTVQLIALLLAERASGTSPGPTLLVVPTSVVSNWKRELRRFAPSLRVHVQHGPERPLDETFESLAPRCDVVITTYTLISRDRDSLLRLTWHRVVLDEAQYIKNPPTKQTSTIRAIRTRRRIALTGTPVENRLSELWSIMEFCNPGYLGPAPEFRRRFALPIERHRDAEKAERLRSLIRPFVLRRLKTDPTVIDDLPACVTTREYAVLTPEQTRAYETTVEEMLEQVKRAEGIQRRGLVLATLVRLKQICNHPLQASTDFDPAAATADLTMARRSGKCTRILTMLEELLAAGDKALVFTQFRRMGHLLTRFVKSTLDAEVLFLHGGTPAMKRQEMIDRFQDDATGPAVFVLSLRAGGVGLNLTAANHVFHFDRWWNPAVENQATDRAFRIGQTRTVHVHKFVCLGTLEERIDEMIEQKTELADNIVGAGEDWLTELDSSQLRDLLQLRTEENLVTESRP